MLFSFKSRRDRRFYRRFPPLIRRRTALKKFRLKFDNGFKRTKERFAPLKITGLRRRRGSLLLTCPLIVLLDSAFKNIPAF